MKQRIRVVGIIRKEDDFLLLKRLQGRSEDSPVWELLTSKIEFGEQPEEAMSRSVFEYLGVHAEKLELRDAVTFVAPDGASQLGNLYIIYEIVLGKDERLDPKDRYSSYKYVNMNDIPSLKIDEASLSVLEIEEGRSGDNSGNNVFRGVANSATVYVDGCSRGNPGPAGVGYYITGPDGQILAQGGEFIGFASSRVAEYQAMKMGVTKALELGLKSVRFVSDNLMMVNQLNGIFRVKNADLVSLYRDVKQMLGNFESVAVVHVKRYQNKHADHEANLAVDRHFKKDMIE